MKPIEYVKVAKLYRYYSINMNFIDSLVGSYLWFSRFKDLNDPHESNVENWDFDYTREDLERLFLNQRKDNFPTLEDFRKFADEGKLNNDKWNKESQSAAYAALDQQSVCCFTRNNHDLLMWTFYADNSKGLVLGFDTNEDLHAFQKIAEVKYLPTYFVPKYSIQNRTTYLSL